ncbi:hypothetical protein KAW80_03060 [Candidatus Babeliales bacterium]|nr:hypothetical protein [Candidatus Babeliales bacterium]
MSMGLTKVLTLLVFLFSSLCLDKSLAQETAKDLGNKESVEVSSVNLEENSMSVQEKVSDNEEVELDDDDDSEEDDDESESLENNEESSSVPTKDEASVGNEKMEELKPAKTIMEKEKPEKLSSSEVAAESEVAPEQKEEMAPELEEKPVAEAKIEEEDVIVPEEKIGEQGNWYEKREWLIKAREVNEKVQERAAEIQGVRKSFWEKFKAIQDLLDLFYKDIGARQAIIKELQSEYEERASKQRVLEEATRSDYQQTKAEELSWYGRILNLTENIFNFFKRLLGITIDKPLSDQEVKTRIDSIFDEEAYEEKIDKLKKDLVGLDKEIKSTQELDSALVKRMDKLDEQIGIAVEDAQKSRILYNEIWKIIDHNKAKENFFQIKEVNRKIKSILEYLQNEFSTDFDSTVMTTNGQIDKVKSELNGIEKSLKIVEEEKAVESKSELVEEKPEKVTEQVEEKAPWYSRFLDALLHYASATWQVLEGALDKLVGYISSGVEYASEAVESKIKKVETSITEPEKAKDEKIEVSKEEVLAPTEPSVPVEVSGKIEEEVAIEPSQPVEEVVVEKEEMPEVPVVKEESIVKATSVEPPKLEDAKVEDDLVDVKVEEEAILSVEPPKVEPTTEEVSEDTKEAIPGSSVKAISVEPPKTEVSEKPVSEI